MRPPPRPGAVPKAPTKPSRWRRALAWFAALWRKTLYLPLTDRDLPITLKGRNGWLQLTPETVRIYGRGWRAWLHGSSEESLIPLERIEAVQFRKPSLRIGYIRFQTTGAPPIPRRPPMKLLKRDPNVILFALQPRRFVQVYQYVVKRISASAKPFSVADELAKLVALKAQGMLTDAELAQAKARLLEGPPGATPRPKIGHKG